MTATGAEASTAHGDFAVADVGVIGGDAVDVDAAGDGAAGDDRAGLPDRRHGADVVGFVEGGEVLHAQAAGQVRLGLLHRIDRLALRRDDDAVEAEVVETLEDGVADAVEDGHDHHQGERAEDHADQREHGAQGVAFDFLVGRADRFTDLHRLLALLVEA